VIQRRRASNPDGIRSAETAPLRIVPQAGKITEDQCESLGSESRRVFHEHDWRQNLGNDALELGPEAAAGAFDSNTSSGLRNILARKSPCNHIGESFEWFRIERFDVAKNWMPVEDAILLSLEKDTLAVGVDFD
jgi:hypothetical protein